MKDLAGLAIVCALLAFCVGSCTYGSTEQTRVYTKFKSDCYSTGGNWNMWSNTCEAK